MKVIKSEDNSENLKKHNLEICKIEVKEYCLKLIFINIVGEKYPFFDFIKNY